MKRTLMIGIGVCILATLGGPARAEYKRPTASKPAEPAGSFDEAVDPARYRKGNSDWDTQELIAGGFRALHEEQLRILETLDRMESRLNELESSLGNIERK